MRIISKEAETEIIVKALFGIIFGMTLSHIVGWTMSLTLSFACILISYTNRGFFGAKDYYRRRMQTQVLMGILLYFAVIILEYFFPELPTWIVFLISNAIFAPLFLYLFYKYQFTPINLTAVISPMMILNTAMADHSYFYWRVILTFLGMIIGWGFAMVYPFTSKVERAKKSMANISNSAISELENMEETKTFGLSDSFKKLLHDINEEMTEITSYLNVVYQDVVTFKYKKYKNDIPMIKALYASTNELLQLIKYIDANKLSLNESDDSFKQNYLEKAKEICSVHKIALTAISENQNISFAGIGSELCGEPDSNLKIFALSNLIKYKKQVTALASSVENNICSLSLGKDGCLGQKNYS